MKKYPWVPIACFILTLGVSYVAGVSGKAAPMAACHDKSANPATPKDELVVYSSPTNGEFEKRYTRLHEAFEQDFYVIYGQKIKSAAEVFLAAAANALGPLTVERAFQANPAACSLAWNGSGNHMVGCCHTADAGLDVDVPLTWRFIPLHPDVSAAGTAFMSGSADSIFEATGSASCTPGQAFLRKMTEVTFTVTYSKPSGKPAKTTGSGSATTSTFNTAPDPNLPPEFQPPPDSVETQDLSDNKLAPGDTKPLSHKLSAKTQFDGSASIVHSVPNTQVKASADSAVKALAEIKFRTQDIHLNDTPDGKLNKNDLTH